MWMEVMISRHHIQAEELASSGQGPIPDRKITPKQLALKKSANLEMTSKKSHGAAPSGVTSLNTFGRAPGISITLT